MRQAQSGALVDIGPQTVPQTWGSHREELFFTGEKDEGGSWIFRPEKEIGEKRSRSLWLRCIKGLIEVSDGKGGTRMKPYLGAYERVVDEIASGASSLMLSAEEFDELQREAATRPAPADAPPVDEEQKVPDGYDFVFRGVPGRIAR